MQPALDIRVRDDWVVLMVADEVDTLEQNVVMDMLEQHGAVRLLLIVLLLVVVHWGHDVVDIDMYAVVVDLTVFDVVQSVSVVLFVLTVLTVLEVADGDDYDYDYVCDYLYLQHGLLVFVEDVVEFVDTLADAIRMCARMMMMMMRMLMVLQFGVVVYDDYQWTDWDTIVCVDYCDLTRTDSESVTDVLSGVCWDCCLY